MRGRRRGPGLGCYRGHRVYARPSRTPFRSDVAEEEDDEDEEEGKGRSDVAGEDGDEGEEEEVGSGSDVAEGTVSEHALVVHHLARMMPSIIPTTPCLSTRVPITIFLGCCRGRC